MQLINLQQSMGRLASPRTDCKSRTDKMFPGHQSIKSISENNALCYFVNVWFVGCGQSAKIDQMG